MYNLTEEQHAFLDISGNIILHACPGSGKTSVVAQKLLRYISDWSRPHQGVAVLSFTNTASEEIERQIEKFTSNKFQLDYPHYVGTLDSFINNFIFLRFGYLLFPNPQRPVIAIKDLYKIPFRWEPKCHELCVNNIAEIRRDKDGNLFQKNSLVTCHADQQETPCFRYKQKLFNKGIIFQSDVTGYTYNLLQNHPEIAQAIAIRFPIIILDEAQDTSTDQMAVLDLINQAGTESMFMVGDPDQSLYEWRNASPECFIAKKNSDAWHTLYLTSNFRSSQLICSATQRFSKSLENKEAVNAAGKFADFPRKPIFILYNRKNKEYKTKLLDYFKKLCVSNDIPINKESVAIVTRGKTSTTVVELWKSTEIELLAEASYEWSKSSRKRSYSLCENALYSIFIGNLQDIVISLEHEIEKRMPYSSWREIVIQVLSSLPDPSLSLVDWVTQTTEVLKNFLIETKLVVHDKRSMSDIIKIKTRDSKLPDFKNKALKVYFEKKSEFDYTFSSVHGVKGETYEALMLLIESTAGNTLTPSLLNSDNLDSEHMRVAYVAMTRPRKLLVVALPITKTHKEYPRFPKEIWEYVNID